MDTSIIARMKELEEDNRRLKRVYGEERIKAEIIDEAISKRRVRPSRRREMTKRAVDWHSMAVK